MIDLIERGCLGRANILGPPEMIRDLPADAPYGVYSKL